VAVAVASNAAGAERRFSKLDGELNRRAAAAPSTQKTSVIVRFRGGEPPAEFKKYARPGMLPLVNGYVLDVPNSELHTLAAHGDTLFASHNATVHAFNFRTSVQSGAFFARRVLGFDGSGVGVAVLDSGVSLVDDLAGGEHRGRVRFFQDFLVPDAAHAATDIPCVGPCDSNGHGTHIAATIAGSGFDSFGERAGMAPGASLYALRVLGADGSGSVDGVIKALGWVLENASARNIRIVNLSFGMAPTGSLPDIGNVAKLVAEDPLAAATKALVDSGIFVVAAAGNHGQVPCSSLPNHLPTESGRCDVWGGITAPGTYPWVFTVGANSSNGSMTRRDDSRATFSSRGPAFPLQNAKPDILAGGVGIESAAVPGSTLYNDSLVHHPQFLINGSFPTGAFPYQTLTGTSQAAAVVSGVGALMLQANPHLTPNLMKAILEYTSQDYSGNKPLEEGAGFLNALGAVRLARFYATARVGQRVPVEPIWSKHFIWGNHEMSGGLILPDATAWALGVVWGVPKANGDTGDNIVWGTSCGSPDCGDNIVWGTSDGDNIVWGTADGDNIVWGTSGEGDNIVWGTSLDGDNIVWGTDCGGGDCGDNIVWGTAAGDGDNIVWGTADPGDNIVWGTSTDGDNIVWGTFGDGDNIVWGTSVPDGDNIVWGTSVPGGDNIVWGTSVPGGDNIVWGTLVPGGDNIVWGTSVPGDDNIVWGTDGDNIVWGTGRVATPSTVRAWFRLFLNRQFDIWWVSQEFGDQLRSRHN
jgi:subtilisin family serine protease